MKIYLDNCTLNRPFDNQNFIKIRIETEAKLFIQEKIKDGKYELIWSYILHAENNANPYDERKNQIMKWHTYSKLTIIENKEILNNAKKINKLNIKPKDSLHIACAIFGNCSYFITTDDLLVKKNDLIKDIEVIYPTNFIELEENNYD